MEPINELINAANQYKRLIAAGVNPENIYIRTKGTSLSFEPHNYGILSRIHRWVYRNEYDFQNSVQQLSELFYKSLRDISQEQLKISENTLSQLANLSTWLDMRIDRYEERSHNANKKRAKDFRSSKIVKKFIKALGISGQQPETAQNLKISELLEAVIQANVQEESKLWGKTTVHLKNSNETREIFIQPKKSNGKIIFFAKDSSNWATIGKIIIEIIYAPLAQDTQSSFPVVQVDWVERTSDLYHDVGTKLMQVAMEYCYFKGGKGHTQLAALTAAQKFHYIIGLRTGDENTDQGIKNGYLVDGNIWMSLPPEGIKEWRTIIKEHPILFATKGKRVMDLLSAP